MFYIFVVNALCMTSEGLLASGSVDKSIKIWDLSNGECQHHTLDGHAGSGMQSFMFISPVYYMKWHCYLDIEYIYYKFLWFLVCCCLDFQYFAHVLVVIFIFKYWLLTFGLYYVNMCHPVTSLCMTPDGLLVSGSLDKSIKIWELKSRKCEQTFEGHSEEGITIINNSIKLPCFPLIDFMKIN